MAKQKDPKEYAREIETVVQDALYNIAQNVGDAIDEAMGNIKDVSDFTLKDIKKGFTDLSKISSVMAQATISASKGEFNRAKATKLILERRAKERALQSSINILELNKSNLNADQLAHLKSQTAELETVKGLNQEIEKALNEQVKASRRVNKAQGLSGAILGGLAKMSSKAGLGGLSDVFQDAKGAATDLADKLTNGGAKSVGFLGKSRIAAKGLGVAFKGAVGYLAGPVGIAMLLGKVAKFLVEIDKRAAMLANSLNMTKLEAALFDREILKASGGIDYLNQRLGEAAELAASFADSTGIIATNLEVFNADLGVISRRFGLSAEYTTEIAKNVLISGQSAEEFAVNALGAAEALEMQNGVNFTNQAIMKDIAELSATQFLNLKAQPGLIANAVTQARRFGLTMSTIEGTQSSLLNFSQSITDEINAELLLGRQLNLSRARSAALQNDYATVAAEISREIRKAGKFSEMNYFQQEALAKFAGMTREELAKSLKEQQALEAAGFASAEARERKYQALRDKGLSQEEALEEIGMEEYTRQKENISFQEKMNNLLHNMKMIFVQSINPLLQKVTLFLKDNPTFIKESVDAVRDLAVQFSEFLSQLINGGPMVDGFFKKFERFGYITDMFKDLMSYEDILKEASAITDQQLAAIGKTRDEYRQILLQANQEQGPFVFGSGTLLVTNETILESRKKVDEFKETLANNPVQIPVEVNLNTDQSKNLNKEVENSFSKAAAAGQDVSFKLAKDAQGNYIDEEGRMYPNTSSAGISTTRLVDDKGNPIYNQSQEGIVESGENNINILPTNKLGVYGPMPYDDSLNNIPKEEKTNRLLERLIYVVENQKLDLYLDNRKLSTAQGIAQNRL